MKITSEDVKAVQQRIEVTYEEAERYLIKADGDIELAVYRLSKRQESSLSKFIEEAKRIGLELLTYYIKIEKKDKVFLNFPLAFLVLFFAIVTMDTKIWVLVVSMGIILISESQVSIYKEEKLEDSVVEPLSKTVKEAFEESTKDDQTSIKEAEETLNKVDDDDDDYYEITIEK